MIWLKYSTMFTSSGVGPYETGDESSTNRTTRPSVDAAPGVSLDSQAASATLSPLSGVRVTLVVPVAGSYVGSVSFTAVGWCPSGPLGASTAA
jgi:hypothetical protein